MIKWIYNRLCLENNELLFIIAVIFIIVIFILTIFLVRKELKDESN